MKAEITKIQRFCTHDGDGIRTTVFFRGCPLRCFWCHNPETWENNSVFFYTGSFCIGCSACAGVCPAGAHSLTENGHIIDRRKCTGCLDCAEACPAGAIEQCCFSRDTEDIFKEIMKDSAFYRGGGGMTLSGGEPTAQPKAMLELLTLAKAANVNTALETCGAFDRSLVPAIARLCDTVLFDYKDGCADRLYKNTGARLSEIEENLFSLDGMGVPVELRCIMIEGVNTDTKNYDAIVKTAGSLKNSKGVRLIPYHPYASSKAVRLGLHDDTDKKYIPTAEKISGIEKYLSCRGVTVLK